MNQEEISSRVAAMGRKEHQGATQLARQAVELLAEMAANRTIPDGAFADLFVDTSRALAQLRPSTASLLNAIGAVVASWLEAGAERDVEAARPAVETAARRWVERQKADASFIADHTAEVIADTAITLSRSSTVLHVLVECWSRGVLRRVIVAESRPLCEGRLTAATLAAHGIPVTLITDAEIGLFVSEAGTAVVGADSIRPNGALVNKTGTLLLALAARRCRVPFYALAESHKISPNGRRGHLPPLDEKPAGEVLPEGIPGVAVRNVSFDVTPARYLTGYITERGLLNRKDVAALSSQMPGVFVASIS